MLEKRLITNSLFFAIDEFGSQFSSFGHWLRKEAGVQKAALTINSYAPFFKEIENRWGRLPSYSDLVQEFGVDYLRRRRIPVRWMSHSGMIKIDEDLKIAVSWEQRIHRMLEDIKIRTPLYDLLCSYRDDYYRRPNPIKNIMKLLRLSLRPAIDFLLQSKAFPPTQGDLNRYLRKKPGQRASLHGFILWLNQKNNLDLDPRFSPARKATLRKQKLERSMNSIQNPEFPETKLLWLKLGLQYFHDLNQMTVKALKLSDFTKSDDAYKIVLNEKSYWLPEYPNMTLVYPTKTA